MSLPPEGIVKRQDHIAATLAITEEFYEVVLFGGYSESSSHGPMEFSFMNETRIVRFGKCDINE